MDKITIIIPCYNEEEVVQRFYDEVEAPTADISDCTFSYLFIDDGSRDKTLAILRTLSEAHSLAWENGVRCGERLDVRRTRRFGDDARAPLPGGLAISIRGRRRF
ncbi:MAG: glycosyltransferase [Schwartzia sp. (in: firmicutes)]